MVDSAIIIYNIIILFFCWFESHHGLLNPNSLIGVGYRLSSPEYNVPKPNKKIIVIFIFL